MDKTKRNEKGNATILNIISATLTNTLTLLTNGTNQRLSAIESRLSAATNALTRCQVVGITPIEIIAINRTKQGAIIYNYQDTPLFIGFNSAVSENCFAFCIAPTPQVDHTPNHLIINKEEYMGAIWAVAKAAPTQGGVNITYFFTP